jgi:2-hydroxy-6-oxonona-2,4-dienedioate hydrolase
VRSVRRRKIAGHRSDINAAGKRLADREHRILRDSRFGNIEYTEGPPMILSYPLFGGFDMMTSFAETFIGASHRFVAPSRFGYLGSYLPPAATPADQADTYALLLDALGIDRAAMFGCSGGGPSAIQFALCHPDRSWRR